MPTNTFLTLKEEKRLRIYNAALQEFNSAASYEDVTIQSIIEHARIPRGSFYQYFTDKDELAVYCLVEIARKSINVTYENNMDFILNRTYSDSPIDVMNTPWFKSASAKFYEVITEDELKFLFETSVKFPIHLQRSASCEHACLYYPYFLKYLREDGSVKPENIKPLAFYLSMADHLYQEYAYMNDMELTDIKLRDEAMSAMFMPLRIILNELRPVRPSADADNDFLISELQNMKLTSIRLLSKNGFDLTLPFSSNSIWQRLEDTLYVSIDKEKVHGSLILSADTIKQADIQETAPADCLIFDIIEKESRIFVKKCSIILNGSTYSAPLSDLVGIGTTQSCSKKCILEHEELFVYPTGSR